MENTQSSRENLTSAEPEDVYVAEAVTDRTTVERVAEVVLTPRRPRLVRPIILFLLTCLSTFWVGSTLWRPSLFGALPSSVAPGANDLFMPFRRAAVSHWEEGLIYMLCLIGILLAHEMGHYVATLIYRVPASLPHFIPFPLGPFGTMGAVIAMDGRQANRRQIFDIGLAGPLAGLAVCVPVAMVGVWQLDFNQPRAGGAMLDLPLILVWALQAMHPTGYEAFREQGGVWVSQLNPYFMAGWFGLLVTAINMAPVSQLDGGHVVYTLFGPRGRWIARGFVLFAVIYIVFANAYFWSVMLLLVILMGVDHPPTADDAVPLGRARVLLGAASLSIPILCLPPKLITLVGM
jgi:hypothetical protein